jgi:hypothetical protein
MDSISAVVREEMLRGQYTSFIENMMLPREAISCAFGSENGQ